MAADTTKLTARELVDKLRADDLRPRLTLTGMVKEAEDDDTRVLFAWGTQCADWTSVPIDAIDTVEVLESVPCKDHAHPFVSLTLTQPASPEDSVYAGLLASAVRRQASPTASRPTVEPWSRERRVRYAKLSDPGVLLGPRSPNPGGCAAACNEYEIFDDGVIRPLTSCRDYGGGVYICYYD